MSEPATATRPTAAAPASAPHPPTEAYGAYPGYPPSGPTTFVAGRGVVIGGDPRQKSPFLASMLSIMPGLGQVYLGYYQRGFIHAVVVGSLITLIASGSMEGLIPLTSIFLAFFWLYNIVDAGRRAVLYNMVIGGGGEIELPQDFKTPGLHGSIGGGIAVIAVGAVLLAHTRFGYSLDWVEDWWPAALVLFGGYLVFKAIQEKAKAAPGSEA